MLQIPLGQAKRIITVVVGFTVLALGLAMLIMPGPGWLTIFLGLSILGAEFVWARLLLRRLKRAGIQVKDSIFGKNGDQRADSGQRPNLKSIRDN
jgi:tellurite resistance protein TerC